LYISIQLLKIGIIFIIFYFDLIIKLNQKYIILIYLFNMGSCHSCGKDEPSDNKFKVVCSDCCVKMSDECNNDDKVRCGCY